MRILVVGAGATGGYFGGRLAATGRDVTFLVRPQRAAQLKATGLQIQSPHGDIKLDPKIVLAHNITSPFDAILLAVKAFSLDQALGDFASAVGPETLILPVLNGMKHLDTLRTRFGDNALVGGVCRIATVVDDEGRIVQLTRLHDLAYGELSGAESARIRQLDDFMQGAGFDATLSRTIEREMWEKWVMLACLGAVTCLMRGSIGEVEAASGGVRFAMELLAEVVAAVTALGHPPRQDFVERTRELLTAKNSTTTSSMYRDLQRDGPIEADQIIGDLLTRAGLVGVATPMLAAAFTHLSVYQSRVMSQRHA
jgi:2-dehydropantoate 2-reductase